MTVNPIPFSGLPSALHRSENELPFVEFMPGLHLQLLQASIENALWVVRTRFAPGITLPRHRHTGEVFALTFSGRWRYLEYPEINTTGSYLYEPAGSIHTLHTPLDNDGITDIFFAIRGANLNLDEQGNVASVWDAGFLIDSYLGLCQAAGLPSPKVIGL
jgi:2,4'-dihydroxyacetophenone dioxygenase